MLNYLDSIKTPLAYHAYTIFLFVQGDIKTILVPITVCAVLAAGSVSFTRLVHTVFWIWLHLLQFCVSNQMPPAAQEEDAVNKPWRPIPAGRLSADAAAWGRWMLVPLCIIVSNLYGISAVSTLLTVCIALHNELGFHSHWFGKGMLTALAYALFDIGAACVASKDPDPRFVSNILLSGAIDTLIVFTTTHAQDFRDEEGDRLEGRKTLPIVAPYFGRLSMPLALCLWSLSLWKLFDNSSPINASVLVFGVYVGLRFYQLRTPAADRTSYTLYNVWLLAMRMIVISSASRLSADKYNYAIL